MKLFKIVCMGGIISFFSVSVCQGQAALLVLILGDKVATEKFHLCIDAGLNISTLPGLDQGKPLYGVNFGLGTFIKLNDKWALTPEFKPLSPRGARDVVNLLPNDATIQNPKTDFSFNYIDVPILLRYKVSHSIFVAAGPQISFLTSANQTTKGNSSSLGHEITVTQDMSSLVHNTTFMVPLEIGYSMSEQRGGKGINIKVRYNIGMMEAFKTDVVASKNSTLQFILSFPFINVPEEGK